MRVFILLFFLCFPNQAWSQTQPVKIEASVSGKAGKIPKEISVFIKNNSNNNICLTARQAPTYATKPHITIRGLKNNEMLRSKSKIEIDVFGFEPIPNFVLIPPNGSYLTMHPVKGQFSFTRRTRSYRAKYWVDWISCEKLIKENFTTIEKLFPHLTRTSTTTEFTVKYLW